MSPGQTITDEMREAADKSAQEAADKAAKAAVEATRTKEYAEHIYKKAYDLEYNPAYGKALHKLSLGPPEAKADTTAG